MWLAQAWASTFHSSSWHSWFLGSPWEYQDCLNKASQTLLIFVCCHFRVRNGARKLSLAFLHFHFHSWDPQFSKETPLARFPFGGNFLRTNAILTLRKWEKENFSKIVLRKKRTHTHALTFLLATNLSAVSTTNGLMDKIKRQHKKVTGTHSGTNNVPSMLQIWDRTLKNTMNHKASEHLIKSQWYLE